MVMFAYIFLIGSLIAAGIAGFLGGKKKGDSIVIVFACIAFMLIFAGFVISNESQFGKMASEKRLKLSVNEIYEVINAVPHDNQYIVILLDRDGTIKTYALSTNPPTVFKVDKNGEYKPYPSIP